MIALGRTYAAYGGRKLAFLRLEFENEATDYETFKVHRDARVVVFDEEQNEEVRLDLFGSIMEKDGRFKLFSHVTDRASKEQEEELFHSFRTLGAWPHFERLG